MAYNNYKYCKEANNSISLRDIYPHVVQFINTLVNSEGYVGPAIFSDDVEVFNLDLVERIIAGNESRCLNKSMDMGFGISNSESGDKNLLLVELRFNYINLNHLKKDDLVNKVLGSSTIMATHLPIHGNYLFIFQSGKTEEARSRLFRMNPRIPNNYLAMDLLELKNTYFE
jgi:hypothetical protein